MLLGNRVNSAGNMRSARIRSLVQILGILILGAPLAFLSAQIKAEWFAVLETIGAWLLFTGLLIVTVRALRRHPLLRSRTSPEGIVNAFGLLIFLFLVLPPPRLMPDREAWNSEGVLLLSIILASMFSAWILLSQIEDAEGSRDRMASREWRLRRLLSIGLLWSWVHGFLLGIVLLVDVSIEQLVLLMSGVLLVSMVAGLGVRWYLPKILKGTSGRGERPHSCSKD